jgi:hypothetical protein
VIVIVIGAASVPEGDGGGDDTAGVSFSAMIAELFLGGIVFVIVRWIGRAWSIRSSI